MFTFHSGSNVNPTDSVSTNPARVPLYCIFPTNLTQHNYKDDQIVVCCAQLLVISVQQTVVMDAATGKAMLS